MVLVIAIIKVITLFTKYLYSSLTSYYIIIISFNLSLTIFKNKAVNS